MVKYYYASSMRIAMRTGTGSGTTGLLWLFGDHLNSTSRVANADGTPYTNGEQRYKPWGEKRYPSGASGLPTTFRYTGQRQEDYIKLYWYGSRWYDDYLNRWIQPDVIIPDPSDPAAYDRYAYSRNNPVRYTDPSGHSWWDTAGQFATGFVNEFALRNVGWVSPNGQRDLGIKTGETSASLVGRIAADAATIVLGVDNVATGVALTTGGTAVACGATLCLGAAATIAGGVAVTAIGASQVSQGAIGLGGNLALLSENGGPGSQTLSYGPLEDIFSDPNILQGKTPSDIGDIINQARDSGWQIETLGRGGHKGQGLMIREVKNGKLTGRIIEWHPGGGHHGESPNWKVSSPRGGTVRIGPQFPK